MPVVTAIYGALLGLMVFVLGLRVSLARLNRMDDHIKARMRVHANLTENAPMFVLGMLTAELCGGSELLLHTAGVLFLAARLAHAVGLSKSFGRSVPRFVGMASTWTLLSAVWLYALSLALMTYQ